MDDLEKALREIEVDQARAILAEAKRGGFMDGDIPETDEEICKEAQYWYKEAFLIHETGMQHDTVLAILSIADSGIAITSETTQSPGGGSHQEPEGDFEVIRPEVFEEAQELYNPGYSSGVPPRSSGGFSESDLREANIAEQHNLPVPRDWEGDPTEMPRDISELTDKKVRQLSGEFNAYLARAKWLLAIATSDLKNATHLRDHHYRIALKALDKTDPNTDKSKLKEVLDAEARDNKDFQIFDKAVLEHQNDVISLKALVEIYSGNVDRLSRDWTFRQDEYNKSVRS